jgi:hypothetical protein
MVSAFEDPLAWPMLDHVPFRALHLRDAFFYALYSENST